MNVKTILAVMYVVTWTQMGSRPCKDNPQEVCDDAAITQVRREMFDSRQASDAFARMLSVLGFDNVSTDVKPESERFNQFDPVPQPK